MTPHRSQLDALCASIRPLDAIAAASAAKRQDILTKPTGSLGRLESLSIQLAGITGQELPPVDPAVVIVFAGDHGVANARAVSAYPSEVTAQMVLNYARGGAVVNVLARQFDARVVAVDVGVSADLPQDGSYMHKRIKNGTADWTSTVAMSEEDALAAIIAGAEVVRDEHAKGMGLLALGEMGIGNTTTSSALLAALLSVPADDITGRGTGVDDAGWQRKVGAINDGLHLHADAIRSSDALQILAALGGLEIAALVGAMIQAASLRVPVIVDGFICSVAALVAVRICSSVSPYLIASHRSEERGHRIALEALALIPMLDMQMRLGEASGATLAIPIVRAAAAVLRETATFESASVSNRA